MNKSIWLFHILLLFLVSSFVQAQSRPIVGVDVNQDIRVAYEVKDDVWEAGVGKALFYVRGLIEAYKSLGVSHEQLHVSVVLHGGAAYWVLNDKPYSTHKNLLTGNPNKKVIRELVDMGISVEVCNATLKGRGWKPEDVLPNVVIVHDAYTRLIDLQQRDYGYIRF